MSDVSTGPTAGSPASGNLSSGNLSSGNLSSGKASSSDVASTDVSIDRFHTIQYDGDDFFTARTASGHSVRLDVKSGRRAAPGPLELFIVGLASCTAADVISILNKKRENVTDYRVEVRTRRRHEHPMSFERIELKHFVRGHKVSPEAVARAIDLSTNKYCSAVSTVRPTAEVVTSFEISEQE